MYNDIDWWMRANREKCIANAHRVSEYARKSRKDVGHFWWPGSRSEKKWYGTHVTKPDGEWDKMKICCSTLPKADTLNSVLPALWKDENCKAKGLKSIHFNGSDDTIELIPRHQRQESVWEDQSTAVEKTSWKVLALNHLVTFHILPNVSFESLNRSVKLCKECSFPHWRVEEQRNKKA